VLIGEGLDKVGTILFDQLPATSLVLCSSTRITAKVPKGSGSPQIEILDDQYRRIPHSFTFTYENTQFYSCCPSHATGPTTLYGEHLDRVVRLYMGGIQVDFTLVHPRQLYLPEPRSGDFLLVDIHLNLIRNPAVTFTLLRHESNICFCAGTVIHTDQGPVEIQKLAPGHTVYGKEIRGLTETYYTGDQLICVAPHAFRPDYPYRETVMSPRHKIWLHGRMIEARDLMGPGVTWVPYRNEKLYNVLLDIEGRMNVQGMICETLDPSNSVAKHFRWTP
jgi:hypothetical protein